jgi:hypothetical protein
MPGKPLPSIARTARVTLVCVLFQVCGFIPNSFATSVNDSQHPQMPLPPQNVVNPPDLTTAYPGVPNQPTAPTAFKKPDVKDAFHCERQFLYKGMTFGCDSYVQRDAERLRLIVADVPDSTQEIDIYQRNRKSVRTAAYIGTLGLVVLIAGLFLSRGFTDQNGNIDGLGKSLRFGTAVGGVGLIGGAVVTGYVALHNNENHIDNAVADFNKVHPSTPITLQFSHQFDF